MKKLILSLLSLVVSISANAAVFSTNLPAGTTNIIFGSGPIRVQQIVISTTLSNLVGFFDSKQNSLMVTNGTYLRATNMTLSITNLQTNAIFEYPGTGTNYLIQTNIYLLGNYRTNVTVNGTSNIVAQQVAYAIAPNFTADSGTIDFTFVNGIGVTNLNAASLIIYYTIR